jgi:hypothetical protein
VSYDGLKDSVLLVIKPGDAREIVTYRFPPGSTVQLGARQIRIPAGETRMIGPYDGPVELVTAEPRPPRKSFREHWDEYGKRPPVERWVSRFSFAVLAPALLLAALVGLGLLVWLILRAVFG